MLILLTGCVMFQKCFSTILHLLLILRSVLLNPQNLPPVLPFPRYFLPHLLHRHYCSTLRLLHSLQLRHCLQTHRPHRFHFHPMILRCFHHHPLRHYLRCPRCFRHHPLHHYLRRPRRFRHHPLRQHLCHSHRSLALLFLLPLVLVFLPPLLVCPLWLVQPHPGLFRC